MVKQLKWQQARNLTVKQTSNNDGAEAEFDLANDIGQIGNDGATAETARGRQIGVNGDGSSVVINGVDAHRLKW